MNVDLSITSRLNRLERVIASSGAEPWKAHYESLQRAIASEPQLVERARQIHERQLNHQDPGKREFYSILLEVLDRFDGNPYHGDIEGALFAILDTKPHLHRYCGSYLSKHPGRAEELRAGEHSKCAD